MYVSFLLGAYIDSSTKMKCDRPIKYMNGLLPATMILRDCVH